MTTTNTNLPATSPAIAHTEVLMDHWRELFVSVLHSASKSDEDWKNRLNSFTVFGLTEFLEPSKVKAKPIEIDHEKLEETPYRRALIKKLKAPRPGKWVSHRLHIDRDRLSDEHYTTQIATLLAWKFAHIVLSDANNNPLTMLLLTRLDESSLTRSLNKFQRHTLSGDNVAHEVICDAAEKAVANNEKLNFHLEEIKAAGAKAREEFLTEMRPVMEKTVSDFESSMRVYLDSLSADVDDYIRDLQIRSALAHARTQKVLDENRPDPNPEASFRASVMRREQEMRDERRRDWAKLPFYLRYFPHAAVVGAVVSSFFFLEIGESGTTPAEALSKMVDWLF